MKILAIDSSGLVASAAVVSEEGMLAEYTINYKKTHSQTLLPMIQEILSMLELEPASLDAVAVSAGPGSFTGLRIGAATAKGLGLALNKPLIAVPTVDALAYNLFGVSELVCPVMDARRAQVYTGLYTFQENELKILLQQSVMGVEELSAILNKMGKPVIFLGDAVPVYEKKFQELIKVPYHFVPCHLARQRAGAVGSLALQRFAEGEFVSAAEFAPIYLRLSQAERERLEQEQKENQPVEESILAKEP